jgi:hypothetical protein
MIWRFVRVVITAVLLGGMVLAFPFHPSASSSGSRNGRLSRVTAVTGRRGHPAVGHFTLGKDTYTYYVTETIDSPQEPEPEPELWPGVLHGPAADPGTKTVTFPDSCHAEILDDQGYFNDFTIWQHLLDPNGAEIQPIPNPHWTSTKPSLTANDTWNLLDPVEGNYTCRADIWVYDYGPLEPRPTDVKTISYVLPTGEGTYPGSWSQQEGARTAYYWYAILTVPNNARLTGRLAIETDGGNTVDTCHYTGSPIASWSGIQRQSGDVDSGNGYTDLVGLNEAWVACYRANGPGCFVYAYPCQVETNQNNLINRPGATDYQYKTNRLKAGMESTYVWSYRDGQAISKPW